MSFLYRNKIDASTVPGPLPTYQLEDETLEQTEERFNKYQDGEWLSTEGPYLDLIKEQCKFNSQLRIAKRWSRDLPANYMAPGNLRVARIQLFKNEATQIQVFEGLGGAAALQDHIQRILATSRLDRRTIFVMEKLAPDYVSVLGLHLFVPPSFFTDHAEDAGHVRSLTRFKRQSSLLNRQSSSFSLTYCQVLHGRGKCDPNPDLSVSTDLEELFRLRVSGSDSRSVNYGSSEVLFLVPATIEQGTTSYVTSKSDGKFHTDGI